MKRSPIHALIIAFSAAATFGSAWAMDTPKPDPKDPDKKSAIDQGRSAIERRDWSAAQGYLKQAVAADPSSADAHNLYAFSIRNGDHPDMGLVFREYNEALRIDPQHRGAHEYLAEAYLMTGNVAKAKELLSELGTLCNARCAEYAKLDQAISTFERQHASK